MKTLFALCLATAFGIALAVAPARAGEMPHPQASNATIDLAAAKKHRKRHYYDGYYSEGPAETYGYSGRVSDPSIGYYPTLRQYQAMGRCVIDLGYGRYKLCN